MNPNSHTLNTLIKGIVDEHDGVLLLDRMEYVCEDSLELCFAASANLEKHFYDYGHLTLSGAVFFGQRIDKIDCLAEIL
tara:strand:+ start:576 stop:812 length:237 start_codon:yes stop_codon:yes gene_type:complete